MNDISCWESKYQSCTYSESLINKINLQNEKSNHKVDILQIKKAIYYAKKYHGCQKRLSGEPYYSHPLAVAELVAPHCFKTDILVTSILHDTIEDTDLTKDLIEHIFDANIASKVEDLTRVKLDRKISSAEMVQLLCIQEKTDLLIVKYFDRLHNIQTINAQSPEQILKTTEETAKAFISLGIYLQIELPEFCKSHEKLLNLCYKSLHTQQFATAKQPCLPLGLFEKSTDNYQLPFLVFQSEKPPT